MSNVSRVAEGQQPTFLGSLLSVLDAQGDLPPAFEDLRAKFDLIRARYDEGALSDERFAAALASLRCFDAHNDPWTIGATSGLWYKMTDSGWLASPPPYQLADSISAASELYRAKAAVSQGAESVLESALEEDEFVGAGGQDEKSGEEENLLFGLPSQLFNSEPTASGPVPFGALPEVDGEGEGPVFRG